MLFDSAYGAQGDKAMLLSAIIDIAEHSKVHFYYHIESYQPGLDVGLLQVRYQSKHFNSRLTTTSYICLFNIRL